MKPVVIAAMLALALAACKGEQKKSTGGTAEGEILPGAASDAMLPIDTVKSQPPLAPKSEGGAKPDAKDAKSTDTAEEKPAAEEPATAPPAAEEKPATEE